IRFDEAQAPASTIQKYVSQLESMPILDSVRLGPTQRVAIAGHEALTFDLTLTAVSLPFSESTPPSVDAAKAQAAATPVPQTASTPEPVMAQPAEPANAAPAKTAAKPTDSAKPPATSTAAKPN